MHGPNFLEGASSSPYWTCPSVKIFNPACRRGSIGRGPWCSVAKKVQTQNRVESDSLGPFVLVSRHLRVWLIRLGLACLVCHQAASIGILACGMGGGVVHGHVGVGEKAEIGEMRESRPWASTTEESSSCQSRAGTRLELGRVSIWSVWDW